MSLSYAAFGEEMNRQMFAKGEWCGVPMPVAGLQLTVEDKNPWKASVAACQRIIDQDRAVDRPQHYYTNAPGESTPRVVNEWWSPRLRCRVMVLEVAGKFYAGYGDHERGRRFRLLMDSMGATASQSVDAEITAQLRLADLIKPHLLNYYLLSGTFLETSPRSLVTYWFRRGRPTLAYRNDRLIAALCLHPIGYYSDTWTGSMVPTDEVIAHLLMMRGDEPMFWRRANQHDPDRPEAGL